MDQNTKQPGGRYEFSRDLLEDYGFLTKDLKYVTYSRFLLSVRAELHICTKIPRRPSEDVQRTIVDIGSFICAARNPCYSRLNGRRPKTRRIFDGRTDGRERKRERRKSVVRMIDWSKSTIKSKWLGVYTESRDVWFMRSRYQSAWVSRRRNHWTCVFQSIPYWTDNWKDRRDNRYKNCVAICLLDLINRRDRQWPMTRKEALETATLPWGRCSASVALS